MNIVIFGDSFAGLISAACFSEAGCRVTYITHSSDIQSIATYEPGLNNLISNNQKSGRLLQLNETSEEIESIDWVGTDVIFIATELNIDDENKPSTQPLKNTAKFIGERLSKNLAVVLMTTAPVGTCETLSGVINTELQHRAIDLSIDVLANPDFIKEGSAITDFTQPDRIIIGRNNLNKTCRLESLYRDFLGSSNIISMSTRDAEMTKLVANTMLASRISLMNEMSYIADQLSVDIDNVRQGIGTDHRIGSEFIYPGCGFGGRYFPKDVAMLQGLAEDAGIESSIVEAVNRRNNHQKLRPFELLNQHFNGDLTGKHIAIWGLAYKPDSDDLHDATSIVIIDKLLEAGARISVYDPAALENSRHVFARFGWTDRIQLASHQYQAIDDADAMMLITEWKPFRSPDFSAMHKIMRTPVIIDGRNQYDPEYVRNAGFIYHGIGRR